VIAGVQQQQQAQPQFLNLARPARPTIAQQQPRAPQPQQPQQQNQRQQQPQPPQPRQPNNHYDNSQLWRSRQHPQSPNAQLVESLSDEIKRIAASEMARLHNRGDYVSTASLVQKVKHEYPQLSSVNMADFELVGFIRGVRNMDRSIELAVQNALFSHPIISIPLLEKIVLVILKTDHDCKEMAENCTMFSELGMGTLARNPTVIVHFYGPKRPSDEQLTRVLAPVNMQDFLEVLVSQPQRVKGEKLDLDTFLADLQDKLNPDGTLDLPHLLSSAQVYTQVARRQSRLSIPWILQQRGIINLEVQQAVREEIRQFQEMKVHEGVEKGKKIVLEKLDNIASLKTIAIKVLGQHNVFARVLELVAAEIDYLFSANCKLVSLLENKKEFGRTLVLASEALRAIEIEGGNVQRLLNSYLYKLVELCMPSSPENDGTARMDHTAPDLKRFLALRSESLTWTDQLRANPPQSPSYVVRDGFTRSGPANALSSLIFNSVPITFGSGSESSKSDSQSEDAQSKHSEVEDDILEPKVHAVGSDGIKQKES